MQRMFDSIWDCHICIWNIVRGFYLAYNYVVLHQVSVPLCYIEFHCHVMVVIEKYI